MTGNWLEPASSWYGRAPRSLTATVCGRLIPRGAWVFAAGASTGAAACSPECEELYYRLRGQRYGAIGAT